MAENNATDPRTDEVKIAMSRHFEAHESEYRDTENYSGSEVVYEDKQVVVVADHTLHQLSEWINDYDLEARAFRNFMHETARELCNYDWSASDPVVFDKGDE